MPKAVRVNRDAQRLTASPWRAYLEVSAGRMSGDLNRIANWPFSSQPLTLARLAEARGESVIHAARYLADLEEAGFVTWSLRRQEAVFAKPDADPFAGVEG